MRSYKAIRRIMVCAVAAIGLGQATQAATVQGLGSITPYAISGDGSVVVGQVGSGGAIWTQAGGVQPIAGASSALGVSADGKTVVGRTSGTTKTGYYWTNAGGLVAVSGTYLLAAASADGSVLAGQTLATPRQAARLEAGSVTPLGVLSGTISYASGISADGSVVVGHSGGIEAFRWTAATGMVSLGDLAGGSFLSNVNAVSADGAVVVGRGETALGSEAFRWTASTGMMGLGELAGGADFSTATSVSADGGLIVGYSTSATGNEAFLWDAANGMRSLKNVLSAQYQIDVAGWTLLDAYISGDGRTFVGKGINPSGQSEAWRVRLPDPQPPQPEDPPTPAVPLPAAVWAGGAMMVGLVLRRRMSQHR